MYSLKKKPILNCFIIFTICLIARVIEYFVIRTDESILSENFLHKVFGIILLWAILYYAKLKWRDIGFNTKDVFSGIGKGLLFGFICCVFAYAIEGLILYNMNHSFKLSFYATGFSFNNDMNQQTGIIFIFLCIIFNITNVWMEEGIFRGLFTKILEDISYNTSLFLIAFLFGIWHLVMPFRDYMEGKSSISNLLVMGIGYVVLAGMMSIKWSLLYRMTGSLWIGLGDHLFNNVISNLLHVVSNNEVDNMQIVRILIWQILSFVIVLIIYKKWKRDKLISNQIIY